jgi:hypothetical protein
MVATPGVFERRCNKENVVEIRRQLELERGMRIVGQSGRRRNLMGREICRVLFRRERASKRI